MLAKPEKGGEAGAKESKKKDKTKNKAIVQEVIDLDVEIQDKGSSPPDIFMKDIAKQCNNFFGWLSDPQSSQYSQHLWKQSMIQKARSRFPHLNFQQLNKLLDRDWKYMGQQERDKASKSFEKCPEVEEISKKLSKSRVHQ